MAEIDPVLFRGIERLVVALNIPLLLWIGYRLFILGVTGEMEIVAGGDSWRGRLTRVTPGAFCFLLAILLSTYALFSKIEFEATPQGQRIKSYLDARFVQATNSEERPLSEHLRNAFYEMAVCAFETSADQECFARIGLKKMPSVEQLLRIEALERQFILTESEMAKTQLEINRSLYLKD